MNSDSEKIKRIEISLMRKISEIENRNNVFRGNSTFLKPLTVLHDKIPEYTNKNIGYTVRSDLVESLNIPNDTNTYITEISLPHPGVYFIRYRLELNLSLGFSCIKSSIILMETRSNKILENINTILNINRTTITSSDNFVYTGEENELNLKLFININYGREGNTGILTVVKNGNFPILTATRIA